MVLPLSLHFAVLSDGKCCSDAQPGFLAPLRRPPVDVECCEDACVASYLVPTAYRCPHCCSNRSFASSCFLNLLMREAVSASKTNLEKPFD